MSANSPIKIKKHVRAPGARKLAKSFKKMSGNVIRWVNESRTSRLCARCFDPFPLNTLSHRFKVCEFCLPNQVDWPDQLKLPTKIVTKKSKRMYRTERKELREEMIRNPNEAVGFVSKMVCYKKNWHQNLAFNLDNNVDQHPNDEIDFTEDYMPEEFNEPPDERILNTIWHRDISAAKLILYRGIFFKLFFKNSSENNV